MAVYPLVEAGDILGSGNNTAETSPDIAYPAHDLGDLIIQVLVSDADAAHTTAGAVDGLGPNDETISNICFNQETGGANGPHLSVVYWVAAANTIAGNQVWTIVSEQWVGFTIRVPAGEFNPTTPIGTISAVGTNDADAAGAVMPAFTPDKSGGLIICVGGADLDPMAAAFAPAGWTSLYTQDIGAVSCFCSPRVAISEKDVEVASATFDINGDDSYTCIGFVVNGKLDTTETGVLSFSGLYSKVEELFSHMFKGIVTYVYEAAGGAAAYTYTASGVQSFVGGLTRLTEKLRTYSGGLSFTGSAQRLSQNLFSRIQSSALSFAATAQRLSQNLFGRTMTGVLSYAGSAQRLLQNLFSRTKDGALSTTGLLTRISELSNIKSGVAFLSGTYSYITTGIKQYSSGYVSNISFSGAYSYVRSGSQRLFTGSASGALTLIGNLYKGWLYGILNRLVERFRVVSGTLSATGTVLSDRGQYITQTLLGNLTASGSYLLNKVVSTTKTSSMLAYGLITKSLEAGRTELSNLTPTGRSIRSNAILTKLYDGALTFSGMVSRGTYATYAGVIDFAGAIAVSLLERVYGAAGALDMAGSFLREIIAARTKDGLLVLSGISSGVKSAIGAFHWVGESGILTITGSIIGLKEKAPGIIAGTLGIIGRITLIDAVLKRITAASITPTSILRHKLVTARTKITASLTPSGILSRLIKFPKSFAGVVSFAGGVTNATTGGIWNYSASGIISFIGAFTRLIEKVRTYIGIISSSGIVSRIIEIFRTQISQISFSGIAGALFVSRDWRLGSLAFAGDVTPYLLSYRPVYMSSLTVTGIVSGVKQIYRSLSGEVTPGDSDIDRYKDILYYGPPNP